MPAKRVSRKAPKVEEERLNDYEMVLILNPEFEDEKLEAMIGNVSRFVTERGGTISEVERWGKRKLAYPLKNLLEGNYVLTRFKFKPGLGKELEANLRITEGVLRHLLVKVGS